MAINIRAGAVFGHFERRLRVISVVKVVVDDALEGAEMTLVHHRVEGFVSSIDNWKGASGRWSNFQFT